VKYPIRLYEKMTDLYEGGGDVRRLVTQAGGAFDLVAADPKMANLVNNALEYLCRDPRMVLRLRNTIASEYPSDIDDDVAREIDDFVAQQIDAPPSVADIELLMRDPIPADAIAGLAAAAGLSSSELREVWPYEEAALRWRSLVLVARLHGKLEPLLRRASIEHADHRTVVDLLRKIEVRPEGQPTSSNPSSPLQQQVAQSDGRSVRREPQGRVREVSQSDASTSRPQSARGDNLRRAGAQRGHATINPSKLSIQRSALQVLDRLQALMNEALENFAQQDAHGTECAVAPDQPTEAYLYEVNGLLERIDDPLNELSEDEILQDLEALVATALAGIRVAADRNEFASVADLAEATAAAYEKAAQRMPEEAGSVLSRVVPYWRMKDAQARHLHRVYQERNRMQARRSVSDALRSSQ